MKSSSKNKLVVFKGIYETEEEHHDYYENPSMVPVTYVHIDNKIYKFKEDPDDGYRSHCNITITKQCPVGAKFNLQNNPVLVKMEKALDRGELITIEDMVTDFRGIVIRSPIDDSVLGYFGTDNIGDYYPGCRMYIDIPKLNEHYLPAGKHGVLLFGGSNEQD